MSFVTCPFLHRGTHGPGRAHQRVHSSSECTLFGVSVLTDASLVTNFSEIGSVSLGPCCKLQIATAPWILSWFAEWMSWNKSSTFEVSAVKWMRSFFLLFRTPRFIALTPLKIGCPVSSNRCMCFLLRSSTSLWAFTCIHHTIFLSRLAQGPSNVLARISSRTLWFPRNVKYILLHSFSCSNQCRWTWTWRLFGFQISQDQCFCAVKFPESLEVIPMK